MKNVFEQDVIKIKFNPNKSAGHDNIGNFVIKKVDSEIVKPLTRIFNLSLSTGIVPDKLKVAKVIPIHKKLMLLYFKLSSSVTFTMLFQNS